MRRALNHPAVARALRPMALVVTDRRWAAPLSALALGFGVFAGVAIGPGAPGTFATGSQVVEIPEASTESEVAEAESSAPVSPGSFGGSGGGEAEPESFPEASFGGGAEESATPESEGGEATPGGGKTRAGETEEPEAPSSEGTVVHLNPAAGSFTIAEAGGTLSTVHLNSPTAAGSSSANGLPPVGRELRVETEILANGTLAEAAKPTVEGNGKHRATVAGVVTFVDPDPAEPAYSVSARGVSLLVHVHPEPSGTLPSLPVLGANAEVKVEIAGAPPSAPVPVAPPASVVTRPPAATTCLPSAADPPPPPPAPEEELWQQSFEAEPTPFTYSDIEGIVEAICPATHELLLSADDLRQSGADLTIAVPEGIDTSRLKIGDSAAATANIGPGETFTLSGLASDEQAKGADDAKAAQGDLRS